MKHRITAIAAMALCLAVQAAWGQSEKNFEGLRVITDIEYVPGGHETQIGDIYRPDTDETLPGIVLVHGGGFVVGSKDWLHYPDVAAKFARYGYVVFTINYRLLDHGGEYPANVRDVNCAVRWFKANAPRFGADGERVGIMGSSAGGYLALMGGYTSGGKFELGQCPAAGEDSTVSAVVDYFGITDMQQFSKGKGRLLMKKFFAAAGKEPAEMFAEASPISYIDNAPPTLIFHGTRDSLVAFKQSEDMYAALEKKGTGAWFVKFEGARHGFINELESKTGRRSHDLAAAFFDMILKEGPECVDDNEGLFVCEQPVVK